MNFDTSLLTGFKDENSQGLLYGMMKPLYLRFGFLYIRPGGGTKKQISRLLNSYQCNDCDVLMGDLNLNPNNAIEKDRIQQLCNENLEKQCNSLLILKHSYDKRIRIIQTRRQSSADVNSASE